EPRERRRAQPARAVGQVPARRTSAPDAAHHREALLQVARISLASLTLMVSRGDDLMLDVSPRAGILRLGTGHLILKRATAPQPSGAPAAKLSNVDLAFGAPIGKGDERVGRRYARTELGTKLRN